MFDQTPEIDKLRSYMKTRPEEQGFSQPAVEKDDFAEVFANEERYLTPEQVSVALHL